MDLSRWIFWWKAIWTDFRQSRRWRLILICYSVIGFILTAMALITTWTPGQLLESWSGKAKVILILGFACFGLILFIVATIDGARRLHLQELASLQQRLCDQEWLVGEVVRDRDDVGQGVSITECEVRVDFECSKPFAEFTFYFFNGSLYPVAIETELGGYVAFSDGVTVIDLQNRPESIKKKSFHNTRAEHDRYVRGEFIIVQKLSRADVDFMSSKRARDAGFFIFDNLTVSVRREGASEASRLRLNETRSRLRNAFRLDSSALAAKQERELAKIYKLEVIRGLGLQLWDELRTINDATPENVFREWEKGTMTHLTENYGEHAAKEIYARCTHDEPFQFQRLLRGIGFGSSSRSINILSTKKESPYFHLCSEQVANGPNRVCNSCSHCGRATNRRMYSAKVVISNVKGKRRP